MLAPRPVQDTAANARVEQGAVRPTACIDLHVLDRSCCIVSMFGMYECVGLSLGGTEDEFLMLGCSLWLKLEALLALLA